MPDLQLRARREAGSAPAIFSTPVYFPYIAARTAATADVELRFDRRGRYQQESFGIATRFPFSFLVKTRRIALAREVIVYPPVEPPDEMFEILPMITGEFETFVRGRGHDLYRIREHLPEDSARHVDWKATAKSMSLKVREFTREDERKLRIVFDNPAPGVVPEAAYEKAVELAASLGWHFAEEPTELSFAAPGYGGVRRHLRISALPGPGRAWRRGIHSRPPRSHRRLQRDPHGAPAGQHSHPPVGVFLLRVHGIATEVRRHGEN